MQRARSKDGKRVSPKEAIATMKRLLGYMFRYYKFHLLIVAACILISAFTTVYGTLFSQSLVDDYILPMASSQSPDFGPLAGALVRELRPAALLCVDSLCSAEPERLGRTLQFSDTGLHPAQPDHSRHLDAARLGVPVLAAGIPTLMQAEEGRDLVVTPRDLDGVIAHGAALLGAAINRALQPKLSVAQLCWLVG